MIPPLHVTTFGTRRYRHAIAYQRRRALRFGAASHMAFGTDDAPVRQAFADNPQVAPAGRGYGYWIWKPYVIAAALRRVTPGAGLLYLDAGVAPMAALSGLTDLVADAPTAFFHPHLLPMRHWTKRDCFVGLGADTPTFWDAAQLSSGLTFWRHSSAAFDLLEAWRTAMHDPGLLTDQPNVLGLPDLEGFVAHRHDQSILTILALRAGARIVPEPTQYGGGPPLLDVHRVAHRWLPRHLAWCARRAIAG